jgi:hypothetical protein
VLESLEQLTKGIFQGARDLLEALHKDVDDGLEFLEHVSEQRLDGPETVGRRSNGFRQDAKDLIDGRQRNRRDFVHKRLDDFIVIVGGELQSRARVCVGLEQGSHKEKQRIRSVLGPIGTYFGTSTGCIGNAQTEEKCKADDQESCDFSWRLLRLLLRRLCLLRRLLHPLKWTPISLAEENRFVCPPLLKYSQAQ